MTQAMPLPAPLDLPLTPPDGITVAEHAALVALFHTCFTEAESTLNEVFTRACVRIVLTTPRYGERVEHRGNDVSAFPVASHAPYPASWTVADLLDAPTGETVATYTSGVGFLPQTWDALLDETIHAWLGEHIAALVGGADRAFALAITDAYDTPLLISDWLEAQGPRPLAPMCARWGADVCEDAQIAALDAAERHAAQLRQDALARERAQQVGALLAHLHGEPLPRCAMAQRAVLEQLGRRAADHGLTAGSLRAFATYAPDLSHRLRRVLAAWAERNLPPDDDADVPPSSTT
jgi:hypothetical protein